MTDTHELKCWPQYFAAILDGSKTFEARKDDRGFKVGDSLSLKEWDHRHGEYSGREVVRKISYILRDPEFGIKEGWCVMGLEPAPMTETLYRPLKDGEPLLPTVADANNSLREAMLEDPEFAWTFHCNLAMAAHDEGVDKDASQKTANRFMRNWLDLFCNSHLDVIDCRCPAPPAAETEPATPPVPEGYALLPNDAKKRQFIEGAIRLSDEYVWGFACNDQDKGSWANPHTVIAIPAPVIQPKAPDLSFVKGNDYVLEKEPSRSEPGSSGPADGECAKAFMEEFPWETREGSPKTYFFDLGWKRGAKWQQGRDAEALDKIHTFAHCTAKAGPLALKTWLEVWDAFNKIAAMATSAKRALGRLPAPGKEGES